MPQIHPDASAPDDSNAQSSEFAPRTSPDPTTPLAVDRSMPPQRPSGNPGPTIRRALIFLGLLLAGSRLAAGMAEHSASAVAMCRFTMDASAIALAGWIIADTTERARRAIAGAVETRIARESRLDASRLEQADRAIAAIERLAVAIETRGLPAPTAAVEDRREQARLIADLAAALRETRLDEAEAMLDRLDADFPDEPARQDLREQLETAQRRQSEERVAQIDAARRVNDADRVLELYALAGPSLEFDRRSELERELARWFLDLIHRRLRIGRIQPEVVGLAARAAEVFGATVEGASLRASLPVLRRSIGLCPRCARPYVGTEAACPQCLAGVLPPSNQVPAPEPESDPAVSDE